MNRNSQKEQQKPNLLFQKFYRNTSKVFQMTPFSMGRAESPFKKIGDTHINLFFKLFQKKHSPLKSRGTYFWDHKQFFLKKCIQSTRTI